MRLSTMRCSHSNSLPHAHSQRGMALVAALLLLVVLTILGVTMFRNFGLQERIAGNTRDKQRALHSAEATQSYVEGWLKGNNGGNAGTGVDCSTMGPISGDIVANIRICTNVLAKVATQSPDKPLNIGGAETAISYTPPGVVLSTSTPAPNTYVKLPEFYISFLQGSYDATSGAATNTYIVNALGYGGSALSVAEVESGYTVNIVYTTTGSNTKFINLGGS